jgi:hypothetical protein
MTDNIMPSYVDKRIRLSDDPVFRALAAADFLCHKENVKLLFTPEYADINRIGSCVGHFRGFNLDYALDFLFNNHAKLRKDFRIQLPYGMNSQEDVVGYLKPPFSNATVFDIADSLYKTGITDKSPTQIFAYAQNMIDQYENWLVNAIIGNPRSKLVDNSGQPLFGLVGLLKEEIKDIDAFLGGTILGLQVMDSDKFRSEAADARGFNIGFGITTPVHLKKMVDYPGIDSKDLGTLSEIDVYRMLPLNPNTPLTVARQIFYEQVLPGLVQSEIVIRDSANQDRDITSGYVRIHNHRGSGTSDVTAVAACYLMGGRNMALGNELADAQDTMQVFASNLHFGGQDEKIIEKLRSQYPQFERLVQKYTQPEYAHTLIQFAFEDPGLPFRLASCSQSYKWRDVAGYGFNPTERGERLERRLATTMQREMWFLNHFGEQFDRGSVSRFLPNWPMGFERTDSREIMDHVLKTAGRFYKARLFPDGSWIYKNTKNFKQ